MASLKEDRTPRIATLNRPIQVVPFVCPTYRCCGPFFFNCRNRSLCRDFLQKMEDSIQDSPGSATTNDEVRAACITLPFDAVFFSQQMMIYLINR